MKLLFPTKFKAQVEAKFNKAVKKFEKAGKPLDFTFSPNDSEQHTFFIDILPEKEAGYIKQYLSDFEATDQDLNIINQYIAESLTTLTNESKESLRKPKN